MNWLHALLFGVIEGVTEFLPISSTGHLTITEMVLGYQIDSPGITAFTAIIQIGAIASAVWYFRADIIRIAKAWLSGMMHRDKRKSSDYRYGWAIIAGSVPIAIIGPLFQDTIETTLRSMWWVAAGLIIWSLVMVIADKIASEKLHEKDITIKHALAMGLAQCVALIPGVSRSGATMSAGLLQGFDRVTVTRLSFFLGIPALTAAGLLQAFTKYNDIASHNIGWPQTIVATITAFIVGYLSIAWLLKYIAKHTFSLFIWYRIVLGLVIIATLITTK